jgi:hypothetical protein
VGHAEGEATLIRLKPGTSMDGRNPKVVGGGPFSLKERLPGGDRAAVPVERDASELSRVSPRAPLPPGEYGFVVLGRRRPSTSASTEAIV